ncbi:MAG: alanine racemase [Galbitalea sp.]
MPHRRPSNWPGSGSPGTSSASSRPTRCGPCSTTRASCTPSIVNRSSRRSRPRASRSTPSCNSTSRRIRGRGGVAPDDLERLAVRVLGAPNIRLRGLMAVAPLGEEPRRAFERVRLASEVLRAQAPDATALSMGMSGDFPAAILEGATHLRIGTAITGKSSRCRLISKNGAIAAVNRGQ